MSRNVPILAISGRQNSAMITDRRKLTTKLNLYGMSCFHFYRWNRWTVRSVPERTPKSFSVDDWMSVT